MIWNVSQNKTTPSIANKTIVTWGVEVEGIEKGRQFQGKDIIEFEFNLIGMVLLSHRTVEINYQVPTA